MARGVTPALLGLALPATTAVAVLLALGWHHRAWLEAPVLARVTIEQRLLAEVQRWQSRDRNGGPPGGVLFGNSLTECAEGTSVGEIVARELAAGGTPHAFVTVWAPAFGPLQHYYLLDDVLAGAPAVAVVELDLWRLGPNPMPGLRYSGLSRKLTLRRALAVREALAAHGVTLLDPSVYQLESDLGMLFVVPGLQERSRALLGDAGTWLNGVLRLRTTLFNPRALEQLRPAAPRVRSLYLPDEGTESLVAVARALGKDLRRAGAQVLFYVAPINLGAFPGLEAADRRLLAERVSALGRAVHAAPEEWLDLHAALATDDFRDFHGHLTRAGCERVGASLAEALGRRPGPE